MIIGQDVTVKYDGEITFDETKVDLPEISMGDQQTSWSGALAYGVGEKDQSIMLKGTLAAKDIFTDLEKSEHHLRQGLFASELDFQLKISDSLLLDGTINGRAEKLVISEGESPLLNLAEISLVNLAGDGSGKAIIDAIDLVKFSIPSSEKIPVSVNAPAIRLTKVISPDLASGKAERLSITDTTIIDGKKPVAHLKTLTAADIGYSTDTGLTINSIDLHSLSGEIRLEKQEEKATSKKQQDKAKASVASSSEQDEPSGLPLKIDKIFMTGKNGVKFTDDSLAEPFNTELTIKSLQVNDIDFNQPNHPFSYSLTGDFDKYSLLKINGNCAPLAKSLVINQQTSLQNISMPKISPYVIEVLGEYFTEGQLDYSSDLKIENNKFNANMNLLLKDFNTEAIEGELASKLDNQLPVPLDLAFTLLSDSKGTVDLDIPISGDLSDINVGLSDIIVTALSKSITNAVTPYLAYTFLGPTGALIFAGAKMGQALLDTDLPNIEYDSGTTELSSAHDEILLMVGKTIAEDQEKTYSICAKVTMAELGKMNKENQKPQFKLDEADRKTLFELGDSRSQAVKNYLLAHFEIKEERLLICSPGMDFSNDGIPRVEFKK